MTGGGTAVGATADGLTLRGWLVPGTDRQRVVLLGIAIRPVVAGARRGLWDGAEWHRDLARRGGCR